MTVHDGSALEQRNDAASISTSSRHNAFPRVQGRAKGYDPIAVDAFLSRAREAFEADLPEETAVAASDVRDVSFALVRGGYAIAPVDAALGRVEDAFAAQERQRKIARMGARAWVQQQRQDAQVVLDRLGRERRHRFERVSFVHYGYRVDEVDLVADRIAGYLADGTGLTVEQVRSVAFRMQRGGYRETQVDAVLDAVVEIMLAVG
ncbi:DivIVA domain-containing protein [Microbacterium sp. SORGH_AS428]|uniref:DivIVA domain-containing protein n=1 Tax=Microbacterium sp. SORGH_AS_0428 TaxID=3041788 RepID=UPI002865B07D|nr:DivIVA domain-containing protein [Microbacterium sp. SORGH_AS_0428]MDR6198229.1 DivIVA domain-containing protein [Microbacterium sp. SORGH_AS_0428]